MPRANNAKGKYCPGRVWNCPFKESTLTCRLRFPWNFQSFKVVVWKDTELQNLLPRCIFSTLTTALKLNKKCENKMNCQYCILKTAGNIAKSSKFYAQTLLLGVLPGTIFGFNLYSTFCSKLNVVFKVVKFHLGSKFGAWVSYRYLVVLKISRKSRADSFNTPLVSWPFATRKSRR